MQFRNDEEKYHTILKLSLLALYILAGFNLIIIGVGYLMAQSHTVNATAGPLIRNVIFLVGVMDFIAIFILKKTLLKKAAQSTGDIQTSNSGIKYPDLFRITIIITAMCAAIPIYGLVLVVLGEKIETLLLFVAMSLVGYQFFRLRARDFDDKTD